MPTESHLQSPLHKLYLVNSVDNTPVASKLVSTSDGEVHTHSLTHAMADNMRYRAHYKSSGQSYTRLGRRYDGIRSKGDDSLLSLDLPVELMPIHPGGGSRFDDWEREKLEKNKMAQKKESSLIGGDNQNKGKNEKNRNSIEANKNSASMPTPMFVSVNEILIYYFNIFPNINTFNYLDQNLQSNTYNCAYNLNRNFSYLYQLVDMEIYYVYKYSLEISSNWLSLLYKYFHCIYLRTFDGDVAIVLSVYLSIIILLNNR